MRIESPLRPSSLLAVALVALPCVTGCERLPGDAAPVDRGAVRGIVFTDWSEDGYGAPRALAELDRIAGDGANAVAFVITAYQGRADDGGVQSRPGVTPSPAAVVAAAAHARALGLAVALKPHVDLDDGSWRGRIDPPDPAAWFTAYRAFLLPWADVAESTGAAVFEVGTELAGTVDHQALWRDLIAAVRDRFSGELIYAASWDEAGRVPFWDALDAVGVDFYYPVARRTDAGRLEILAGWQPWLERLRLLSRQTGRPVLLTEIGYRSVDGAGLHPADYATQAPLDLGEQADLYWGALEATGGEERIAGLYWWNWLSDGDGGPGDRDYTPEGKPAEDLLIRTWSAP
jgi:Glycoside Hydrolase Family 113